jgi:predicted TIM-barrel fold metal-dependent hydrolase
MGPGRNRSFPSSLQTTMPLIALEEHITTPLHKTNTYDEARQKWYRDRSAHIGHDIEKELLDVGESRLAAMDRSGISLQVLSLTTPGTQAFSGPLALEIAIDANDRMARAVAEHPDRFRAFAALPTSDVGSSQSEFERNLGRGFVGALISGHTGGLFLDDRRFWPLFELAQSKDVPIYIHPGAPHPGLMGSYFNGYEDLARPAWGFAMDASMHFLRLLFAGIFDAFPRLKIILGHLGEGLPFGFDRMVDHTPYVASRRGLKRSPRDCFRENLYITTSGAFSAPAFRCAVDIMGEDNIMFSVDWPYESNRAGAAFFETLELSDATREKIGWSNAARLLRIEPAKVKA